MHCCYKGLRDKKLNSILVSTTHAHPILEVKVSMLEVVSWEASSPDCYSR